MTSLLPKGVHRRVNQFLFTQRFSQSEVWKSLCAISQESFLPPCVNPDVSIGLCLRSLKNVNTGHVPKQRPPHTAHLGEDFEMSCWVQTGTFFLFSELPNCVSIFCRQVVVNSPRQSEDRVSTTVQSQNQSYEGGPSSGDRLHANVRLIVHVDKIAHNRRPNR